MDNYKKGQAAYDKKDYVQAISYWKPLAELGYEEAINAMGNLYATDDNSPTYLPEDLSKALYYFKKGALKGNNYSLFRLGMFYDKGLEVKQDRQKARELFKKAWEKGEARSVYALATSNFYDEFNPDYKEAYFCFNALSEVNQSDAHFFLADMCMYGKGVKKDYAEAYKHLILAGITENEEERKYWEDGLSNTEEYTRAINRGVWLLHKELTKLINPIELNRAKHLASEFKKRKLA
jgi:uncharacterized protein